jgi:hypothetical protein
LDQLPERYGGKAKLESQVKPSDVPSQPVSEVTTKIERLNLDESNMEVTE